MFTTKTKSLLFGSSISEMNNLCIIDFTVCAASNLKQPCAKAQTMVGPVVCRKIVTYLFVHVGVGFFVLHKLREPPQLQKDGWNQFVYSMITIFVHQQFFPGCMTYRLILAEC